MTFSNTDVEHFKINIEDVNINFNELLFIIDIFY